LPTVYRRPEDDFQAPLTARSRRAALAPRRQSLARRVMSYP
jgi:hypothetical protein